MEVEKAKLLCSFGGNFVSENGKAYYMGGKTRLVSMEISTSFDSLVAKMAEVCEIEPGAVDIRYQLPDGGLCDSRLVSVENDDDVRNMMDEFGSSRKIPVFLFVDMNENTEGEEEEEAMVPEVGFGDSAAPMVDNAAANNTARRSIRDSVIPLSDQDQLAIENKTTTAMMPRREHGRPLAMVSGMNCENFWRDSQSLVVGQEYEDVQTFRNALNSAAIAAKFEIHMIRSDQHRVTARLLSASGMWGRCVQLRGALGVCMHLNSHRSAHSGYGP